MSAKATEIKDAVVNRFTEIRDEVTSKITQAKDWVVQKFNDIVSWVSGLPGRISSAAAGMWDGISSGFKGMLNRIIGWWNRLSFQVPGFSFMGLNVSGFTLSTPDIAYFNEGGIVPGYSPGVDNQLAAVSGGEAIRRPEWTAVMGPSYVDAANKAAVRGGVAGVEKFLESFAGPRFATGGVMPGGSNFSIASPSVRRDPVSSGTPVGQGQPLVGSIVLNGARSVSRGDAQIVGDYVGWVARTRIPGK